MLERLKNSGIGMGLCLIVAGASITNAIEAARTDAYIGAIKVFQLQEKIPSDKSPADHYRAIQNNEPLPLRIATAPFLGVGETLGLLKHDIIYRMNGKNYTQPTQQSSEGFHP